MPTIPDKNPSPAIATGIVEWKRNERDYTMISLLCFSFATLIGLFAAAPSLDAQMAQVDSVERADGYTQRVGAAPSGSGIEIVAYVKVSYEAGTPLYVHLNLHNNAPNRITYPIRRAMLFEPMNANVQLSADGRIVPIHANREHGYIGGDSRMSCSIDPGQVRESSYCVDGRFDIGAAKRLILSIALAGQVAPALQIPRLSVPIDVR